MKRMIKLRLILAAAALLASGCGSGGEVVYQTAESSAQAVSSADPEDSGEDADGLSLTEGSSGVLETEEPGGAKAQGPELASTEEVTAGTIVVYVCGAVERPGVYELPDGSRVWQAIEAAGGMKSDADDRYLNQAQRLSDGEQITVYTRDETAAMAAAGQSIAPVTGSSAKPAATETGTGKVNINTAGKEELMTLPGIGEAKAEAIIQYRENNGAFSSPEEIRNVSGIKEKAYERIKDCIEV